MAAIDPRHLELIHADIDGEISVADKAELDAFLARSSEGRAVHDELAAVARSLDNLPEIEPPEHLRHVILNMATGRPVAAASAPGRGAWRRFFETPVPGYIGTFAAGVLLTLALVSSDQLTSRALDDVTGLVGTVASPDQAARAHGRLQISRSELAGTVTLRSSGPILIIDFDLSASEPVQIVARYADKTIWFNGFGQLESRGTTVAAETGTVRLTMNGSRRYAVYLNNPGLRPTDIEMQFLAGGDVIHESTLRYDGEER